MIHFIRQWRVLPMLLPLILAVLPFAVVDGKHIDDRLFVIDQYLYSVDRENRLRCIHYKKKCSAKAVHLRDKSYVPKIGDRGEADAGEEAHTCGRKVSMRDLLTQELRMRILRRSLVEPTLDADRLLTEEKCSFKQCHIGEHGALADCVASDLNLHNIKKSIRTQRRAALPKHPTSAAEALDAVKSSYKYCHLLKGNVKDGDDEGLIFFPDDLPARAGRFSSYFIDGTFKTVPRIFYQVVTLFGKVDLSNGDAYYVPLAHMLLTAKTSVLYVKALEKVQELVPDLQPVEIMSDFENSLRVALRTVFPGAIVRGCNFHLGQALYRKVQSVGLQEPYASDDALRTYLLSFTALSWLPVQFIEDGFNCLTAQAAQFPQFQIELDTFIAYFRRFWMEQIGPAGFSVFGARDKTNNCVSYFLHKKNINPLVPGMQNVKICQFIIC